MITWQEILLRLLLTLLFCGAVGVERYFAGKAAGVRTHILVGLGAALFTLISGYAFHTTAANADRIAAQVVTGIGFIGGGAILKEGGWIKGLTTAAGLWAVAALGMAAGAGLYTVGWLGTGVILLTLVVLRQAEHYLPRHMRQTWVLQLTLSPDAPVARIREVLDRQCRVVTVDGRLSEEGTTATFEIEMVRDLDIEVLARQLYDTGARVVSWRANEIGSADTGP